MRRFSLILIFCFLTTPTWAAITIDATTTAEGTGTGNISLSHTAAADATLALACVGERSTTATLSGTTTATYAGNAMTQIGTLINTARTKATLFYYVSPGSGSSTVAMSRATGSDRYIMSVTTLKGTATSSIFNTAATGGNTTSSLDINSVASAVGDLVWFCGLQTTTTPVITPDATSPVSTELVDVDHTGGFGLNLFVYYEDGANSTVDMRVDSDTATYWSGVAVSIAPGAEAAAFGPLRRRH